MNGGAWVLGSRDSQAIRRSDSGTSDLRASRDEGFFLTPACFRGGRRGEEEMAATGQQGWK